MGAAFSPAPYRPHRPCHRHRRNPCDRGIETFVPPHPDEPGTRPRRRRRRPRRRYSARRHGQQVYGTGDNEVHAVSDATMAVDQGEFVALVGPSGSGKTTLISMIGGLLSPSSERSPWRAPMSAGLSKRDLTKFRAERVGFVFQAANLVPFLTARENLLYVATLQKRIGRKGGTSSARRPTAGGARNCPAGPRTCPSNCPAASASGHRPGAR